MSFSMSALVQQQLASLSKKSFSSELEVLAWLGVGCFVIISVVKYTLLISPIQLKGVLQVVTIPSIYLSHGFTISFCFLSLLILFLDDESLCQRQRNLVVISCAEFSFINAAE